MAAGHGLKGQSRSLQFTSMATCSTANCVPACLTFCHSSCLPSQDYSFHKGGHRQCHSCILSHSADPVLPALCPTLPSQQDYFFHKEGTANGGNRYITVSAGRAGSASLRRRWAVASAAAAAFSNGFQLWRRC